MKVGLFDSGVGGLSVLKRLMEKYPNNEYIYFGDTKNLPYGSKSIEELKILAKNNIEFLLKFNVDIIVIACGTVSSNCLDYLKDNYIDYSNNLTRATSKISIELNEYIKIILTDYFNILQKLIK